MNGKGRLRPVPLAALTLLVLGVLAGCLSGARTQAVGQNTPAKAVTLSSVKTALKSGKPVFIELSAPW